jgi:hypothetical protein
MGERLGRDEGMEWINIQKNRDDGKRVYGEVKV